MDIAVYYTLYFRTLNQTALRNAASKVLVQEDSSQLKALNCRVLANE